MSLPALHVHADFDTLALAATEFITRTARQAIRTRGQFALVLAGGQTPGPIYDLLTQPPHSGHVDWSRTHLFWGDERLVPPDDPESNYALAHQRLIADVPLPDENAHRIPGELPPAESVRFYTDELAQFAQGQRAWPRFDLVLLGMGSDGHTASLFPGQPTRDETNRPVIAVTADYDGRPAGRITLTPLAFNAARNVAFIIQGASKAEAFAEVIRGAPDPNRWPAQRIQPFDGAVTWFADQAAAARVTRR